MVGVIDIPSEVLNTIYSAATSKLMDLDEVKINVTEGRFKVYHRNAECSGMFVYESEFYEDIKDLTVDIPMFVKDIKTVLSIVKKGKANFTVNPGETIFRFEKLTKHFPHPTNVSTPEKLPAIEVTTKIEMSDKNMEMINDSFSDIKNTDIKIFANNDSIKFEADNEIRKTNIVFEPTDVISYSNTEKTFVGFDKDMAISMFNVKKDGKYTIELGNRYPMKVTQEIPSIGKVVYYIAPKIYD